MSTMALNLFSSSLRTFRSSVGCLSGCRWNSTAATSFPRSTYDQPATEHNASPRLKSHRKQIDRKKFIQNYKAQEESKALEKFANREWRAGEVYAPHDLSAIEMKKWRKHHAPSSDIFDAINMNPLDLYKNFVIMSEYMTSMGRIKHRNETGLRPVNQRKIAKAIRRAIGVGLMPSVHRHPEILAAEVRSRLEANAF